MVIDMKDWHSLNRTLRMDTLDRRIEDLEKREQLFKNTRLLDENIQLKQRIKELQNQLSDTNNIQGYRNESSYSFIDLNSINKVNSAIAKYETGRENELTYDEQIIISNLKEYITK